MATQTLMRRLGATLLTCIMMAGAAGADMYAGAAGGAAVPWAGDLGWSVMGEIGTDWSSPHVRVGGEFAYTSYDQDVDFTLLGLGKIPIELRTYELRFVTRYVLFPDKLTPYIGAGGQLALIDLDDSKVRALVANPFLISSGSRFGFGGGVLGLLGLEVPIVTKQVNFFVEGRVSYTWEITSNLGPIADPQNYSGFSGIAGLRARF